MSLPATLPQEIQAFLTRQDVDLKTVSLKQIRRHLAEALPELDVKALKEEINQLIIPIFTQMQESAAAAAAAAAKASDSAEAQITDDDAEEGSETSAPALASHQIGLSLPSSGIPGGAKPSTQVSSTKEDGILPFSDSRTPHTRSAKPKAGGAKSRKRKSAAFVDTEDEDGQPSSGPKPKKVKKPRAPRQSDAASSGKGIHKEMNCSPALADVIGCPTTSRPQAVKKLWEYIKKHDLQNPGDKRQILCDELMLKVFNIQSLNMFHMNKLLGQHLWTNEEVVQP